MPDIKQLMIELDGADPDTVNRLAWKHGSLPVRLAMLGLASVRKGVSPLWWGYPPGVFISYKWDGVHMRDIVTDLAEYVRGLGYNAFVDIENLDDNADAYFRIPKFIASLQDCTFYILLLTGLSADLMTGRKGKTSWIHDEFQHAVRIANSGRLFIVPVLLEPNGTTDFFTIDNVLDLTDDQRAFGVLDNILTSDPVVLNKHEVKELKATVARFDYVFLNEKWDESDKLLLQTRHLSNTFDHRFRRMLHCIYTADEPGLNAILDQLRASHGQKIISHIYKGYCNQHNIPNREK